MRKSRTALVCSLAAAFALTAATPALAGPAVVELFQSQGCSSCPPAVASANALADRPDLLVLDFAVTYRDRLGWKDTFARPEFTSRQYDYSRVMGRSGGYTPQMVVDGRREFVGSDPASLRRALQGAGTAGPAIAVTGGVVSVAGGAAPPTPADVWLVRYDPRSREVAIGAGENTGLTLAHRNMVRQLTRLGQWSGAAHQYALPSAQDAQLHSAILIQSAKGGAILAAAKL